MLLMSRYDQLRQEGVGLMERIRRGSSGPSEPDSDDGLEFSSCADSTRSERCQ